MYALDEPFTKHARGIHENLCRHPSLEASNEYVMISTQQSGTCRAEQTKDQCAGKPSPPIDPWGDGGDEGKRTSAQARLNDGDGDGSVVSTSWWAGAFGAVSEMNDGPEERGHYAWRFCKLFFPDRVEAATQVRACET